MKRDKINQPSDGKCGYIALYKNKQGEVYANSAYEAQTRAAQFWKVKKSYEVSVTLCEKDGKEVVHVPVD